MNQVCFISFSSIKHMMPGTWQLTFQSWIRVHDKDICKWSRHGNMLIFKWKSRYFSSFSTSFICLSNIYWHLSNASIYYAAVHGVTKSQTWLSNWTKLNWYLNLKKKHSLFWYVWLCKLHWVFLFLTDFWWSLGFTIYEIMSSGKWITFMCPFQFGCLVFLFCLITLARTSDTTLNRSGENGDPCLVTALKG